jgi:hypothetical protein
MKRTQKRGYQNEKAKAYQRGGVNKGSPDSPGYVKGKRKGEVKNWSRPVDRATLIELRHKGINKVVSKRGFTDSPLWKRPHPTG